MCLFLKMVAYRTVFVILISIGIQKCFIIASETSEFPLPERFKTEPSVFAQFKVLLNKYNPLNLGEGSSDYTPPKEIQDAVVNAITSKDYSLSQYAPDDGHPRLLKAVSKLYSKLINRTLNPADNVLITIGATESLFLTFLTHTFPGDEWIIFEPFYEYYLPMIKATHGVPRFIKLKQKIHRNGNITSADWTFDKEELSKLFNEKTKGILLNTPHNPTGKVFTLDELTFIANLAKKWRTLVVCDEVYEFLTFGNSKHIRIATLPGMFERTITICSAGKLFAVTGYRIGWAYGDAKILRNLKVAQILATNTVPTPLQDAVAAVLEQEMKIFGKPNSFFEILRKRTEANRDYLYQILNDFGMNPILPEGGYYITANWTTINRGINLNDGNKECDDFKFAKWLISNVKVLGIPVSSFYKDTKECSGKDLIRFTIIKARETYEKAGELFSKWQLE